MKTVYCFMFGAIFFAPVFTSKAQSSLVTPVNLQPTLSVAGQPDFSFGKIGLTGYAYAGTLSYSSSGFGPVSSPEPFAAGMVSRAARPKEHRTLDGNYYLLNGMHLGMGLLDVGLTQHCIAAHQCAEGNPLMPSSLVGQLSVNLAMVGYAAYFSYNLKKRHSSLWRISPASGIATHSAGVVTGLMH